MDINVLMEIYNDDRILEYLRYNPHWYKILYYEPERYDEFVTEAKQTLKITLNDRINGLKNQLDFVTSLIEYIKK